MKNTKRLITYFTVILALGACAKTVSYGPNFYNERYLESWLSIHHPAVEAEGLGIYVIDQSEGNGEKIEKDGYAFVSYSATDLNGNYSEYTDQETARQMGTYDSTYYYGPKVMLTQDGTIQAGLQNAIVGMKVGGEKEVIIPSWLMSYSTFSTPEQYKAKTTDYSHTIYKLKIEDYTKDIDKWQIGKIEKHLTDTYGSLDDFNKDIRKDTTGFYYRSLVQQNIDTIAFKSDTTIYINYIGKLLNGKIFDTNVERIAKDNGIHDSGRTYEPAKVKWGQTYSDLTMNGSNVISGFAMALWNMNDLGSSEKMDKCVSVFYSPLGYGYSGSGNRIPGYAPLVFEIEIVPEP